MLYEIMRSIKNYFLAGEVVIDTFKIEDGAISLPFLKNGDYFLIKGSRQNDGVYIYPAEDLNDEEFNGEIAILAPPSDFLALVEEIKSYTEKTANLGPYDSESFGGYSYSIAKNASGSRANWSDVYRTRLNAWRKI